MNNLDDPVLLFRGHFVVGWEAEASAEDVGAYVLSGAGDVSVGTAAAVALGGYEGVGAVDRLHMHRLPDGAAFGIESGQGVQDLMGAALTGLGFIEIFLLAADRGSHSVLVDD